MPLGGVTIPFLGGPSPVTNPLLGPVLPAVDAVTSDPTERQKKALTGKYKNISQYIPNVQSSAQNARIPATFLFGILAVENGGIDRWGDATSPAGAQGIAQFMPATWADTWNPYRKQSPRDPKYAIPAAALYLARLLKASGGKAYEAAQSYNGGSTRNAQTAAYARSVLEYMRQADSDSLFASGGLQAQIPGVSQVQDAARTVADLIQLLLNPRDLGQQIARAGAYVVRFAFKAMWDYALAPIWHWHQRATVYYMETYFAPLKQSATPWAGIVTVSFWATGYAVLWAKIDSPRSAATDPHHTPLGRTIFNGQSLLARRKITKPSQVTEKTLAKPEPVESTASLRHVNTLSATRARAVTVTGGESEDGNPTETGSRNNGSASVGGPAASAAPVE